MLALLIVNVDDKGNLQMGKDDKIWAQGFTELTPDAVIIAAKALIAAMMKDAMEELKKLEVIAPPVNGIVLPGEVGK